MFSCGVRPCPTEVFSPLYAHANAKKAFQRIVEDGGPTLDERPPFLMASALKSLGFYQRAKQALEPALRMQKYLQRSEVTSLYAELLKKPVGVVLSVFDCHSHY